MVGSGCTTTLQQVVDTCSADFFTSEPNFLLRVKSALQEEKKTVLGKLRRRSCGQRRRLAHHNAPTTERLAHHNVPFVTYRLSARIGGGASRRPSAESSSSARRTTIASQSTRATCAAAGRGSSKTTATRRRASVNMTYTRYSTGSQKRRTERNDATTRSSRTASTS